MRSRALPFLLPLTGIALLLGGCTASSPAGGGGAEPTETAPSTTAPTDAVTEYVECLHEHGLDAAVVNPDGSVGYAFDEDDLDDGVVAADSGDTAAAEAACREAVPDYSPPDENER